MRADAPAGSNPLLDTAVTLMHFADAPPAGCTEAAYSGQLVEDAGLVEQFPSACDLARTSSLSPEASSSLVGSAAKGRATDARLP
ncbi:Scr1 family TA system antitoxin-like transcriptional regulator [Streptomyces sp. NPDC014623]|uniref:Scr1 family TA system antitoxin-like transcriptional regulator n=1 Tax=Streptomyces sp. NPDC014623 TaxID=3364875 RepID=UPI0036FE53A3